MPSKSTQFSKIFWGGIPPDPPSFSCFAAMLPSATTACLFHMIAQLFFLVSLSPDTLTCSAEKLLIFCSDGLTTLDPALNFNSYC